MESAVVSPEIVAFTAAEEADVCHTLTHAGSSLVPRPPPRLYLAARHGEKSGDFSPRLRDKVWAEAWERGYAGRASLTSPLPYLVPGNQSGCTQDIIGKLLSVRVIIK